MKQSQIASALALVIVALTTLDAQRGAGRGGPPPSEPNGVVLELTEGTRASYRAREQLAGIPFPSDAVGTTSTVTGTLVLLASGSIDASKSKLTLDLRTFRSDQSMRDAYLQRNTFESEKFPLAEFTPRRVEGLTYPLPHAPPAQSGFQLIGDMTVHGVTAPLTWNVIATYADGVVSGTASTEFPFSTFGLTKPSLARIVSVADTVRIEIEFKARRAAL